MQTQHASFEAVQVNAPALAERWWAVALRGLAAVAFGAISLLAPGVSLLSFVALYGAYALVDGVFNLLMASRTRRAGRRWGWFALAGVAGIGAAAVTLFWPALTTIALLIVIAAWAIMTGAAAIVSAVRLRQQLRGEWLLALSGVLSLAFGVVLLMFPALGALAVVFWIGAYALVLGGLLLALSLRLRSWAKGGQRQLPGGGAALPA